MNPAPPMTIPERGQYKLGQETRFRFFYPRPDPSLLLQGQWRAFDRALLACAPMDHGFIMHYESDDETCRKMEVHMRQDLRIPGGEIDGFFGFFRKTLHYVIEREVPLEDVTAGRFDWGVWWDVAVCADPETFLERMSAAEGTRQGLLLHDGPPINGDPKLVLFRNFYCDEVSVRCRDGRAADAIFELASLHRIPMVERNEVDFYEGTT